MNIWTGLLFLDGAIADPRLARELAGAETTDAAATRSEPSTASRETPAAAAAARPAGSFRGAVPH